MNLEIRKFLSVLALGTAATVGVSAQSYYSELISQPLSTTSFGYSRNDDSFFGPVSLGFSFNFFGNTYTQLYINNNGNVTFGGGESSFSSAPLNNYAGGMPMIAPFFADVDTRNGASGLVYLNNSVANQLIITWDAVGYFDNQANLLNSFQLVIRGPGYSVPSGEGQIGFYYKTMDWDRDQFSAVGTAGFGDGLAAVNAGEVSISGSQTAGFNNTLENNHYWFTLSEGGVPAASVPEPGTWGAIGVAGVAGLVTWLRRRKA